MEKKIQNGKKSKRKTIVFDHELALFLGWYQEWELKNSSEFIRNLIRTSREFEEFKTKEAAYKIYLAKEE